MSAGHAERAALSVRQAERDNTVAILKARGKHFSAVSISTCSPVATAEDQYLM